MIDGDGDGDHIENCRTSLVCKHSCINIVCMIKINKDIVKYNL